MSPRATTLMLGVLTLVAGTASGCDQQQQPTTIITTDGGSDADADGGRDTERIPAYDLSTSDGGLLAPDATPACGPVKPKTNGYYPVPGDPGSRTNCNDVCGEVCLSCDGGFQVGIGAGLAYRAEYGPKGSLTHQGGTCDDRPPATQTDPVSGAAFELSAYECYCKP